MYVTEILGVITNTQKRKSRSSGFFYSKYAITIFFFALLFFSWLFCHFSSYITNFNHVEPQLAQANTSLVTANFFFFFQTDPQLAQAILGNDLNKLQQLLMERNRHKSEMRRQQDEELVRYLNDNNIV